MGATKPRIKIPDRAAVGDVIEIKTLITHVMETGSRKDKDGNLIPREIIHTFVARFASKEVFRAAIGPGISANPFIAFYVKVPGPGSFEFAWTDDNGEIVMETAPLAVV